MRLRRVLLTDEDPCTDYRGELNLRTSVAETSCVRNGVHYRRSSFVSYPAQVDVVRLKAPNGLLDFALALDSQLRHTCQAQGNCAWVSGVAPEHAEPSNTSVKPMLVYPPGEESRALRFAAAACIAQTDGEIRCDGRRVYVAGAGYAVVLISTGTDYAGHGRKRSGDAQAVLQRLKNHLHQATEKGYDCLLAEHLPDVTPLFDGFSMELGVSVSGDLPTSQRLTLCAGSTGDPKPDHCRLALGYGPLNLQGIWNGMVSPPRASNNTININLEMNYWPSTPFHLGQCAEPLLRLV